VRVPCTAQTAELSFEECVSWLAATAEVHSVKPLPRLFDAAHRDSPILVAQGENCHRAKTGELNSCYRWTARGAMSPSW